MALPREQELRFKHYCETKSINGKVTLKDVKNCDNDNYLDEPRVLDCLGTYFDNTFFE